MRIFIIFCLLVFANNALSKEVVVEVYKMKFIPQKITIEQGDTVVWRNIEKRQYHSVWFKQIDKEEPDYFFPDETYRKEFLTRGDFPYECGPHPRMTGIVVVIEKKN